MLSSVMNIRKRVDKEKNLSLRQGFFFYLSFLSFHATKFITVLALKRRVATRESLRGDLSKSELHQQMTR